MGYGTVEVWCLSTVGHQDEPVPRSRGPGRYGYSERVGRCTLALVAAGLAAFGLASGAVTPPAAAQSVQAAPPVTLDVALDRTATYIDSFIDHFGNVVSEERYQQEAVPAIRMGQLGGRGSMASVPQTQKRTLRSDFLLVKPEGSADWFPFRDVYEVDGNAIRDREGRLAKLFLKDSGIALDRATLADWVGRAAWYLKPL